MPGPVKCPRGRSTVALAPLGQLWPDGAKTAKKTMKNCRFIMVLGFEVITPEGLEELNYYKYSGTDR